MARKQIGEEEDEQRRRAREGGDDAHVAEAEGGEHEEYAAILKDAAQSEVAEAAPVAAQRALVPRGGHEGGGGDERRGDVDGGIEERSRVAEPELAHDRHRPEAGGREQRNPEVPDLEPHVLAGEREQDSPYHDHERA